MLRSHWLKRICGAAIGLMAVPGMAWAQLSPYSGRLPVNPGVFGWAGGMNTHVYNPHLYNPSLYSNAGSAINPWAVPQTLLAPGLPLYPLLPFDSALRGVPIDLRARLHVVVPANDAEVWFEGVKMKQTGRDRYYFSPALDPNSRYSYDVRVRWRDKQGEHSQNRRVTVTAGATQMLDFTGNN
jgi:uncharacterized protein (TIGR03000 family)